MNFLVKAMRMATMAVKTPEMMRSKASLFISKC